MLKDGAICKLLKLLNIDSILTRIFIFLSEPLHPKCGHLTGSNFKLGPNEHGKNFAHRLRMLICLGFAVIAAFLLRFHAPFFSAPVTEQLHQICLSACPLGDHAELYRAIVCGAKLESVQLRADFAQVGLIHLLVVSGSHLAVLETLSRFTVLKPVPPSYRTALSLSILFLFTLMTKASPPVLRAFLGASLTVLNAHYLFNWSHLQRTTIAGFLTLPFCFDGWSLCSLLLSWLAAIALVPTGERKTESFSQKIRDAVQVNTKVYLALLPALALLSVPHPATIPSNVVFGPLLGLVLFPLSLAAVALPPLVALTDPIWNWVRLGTELLASHFPQTGLHFNFPKELLVIHLAALTFLFTLWKSRRMRKRLRLALKPAKTALPFLSAISTLITLSLVSLPVHADELVVWNVGQGSWATVTSASTCHHFDLGGEIVPWKKIEALCRSRQNKASISHWDLDHIAFIAQAAKRLPQFCLQHRPLGDAPNRLREAVFNRIPDCDSKSNETAEGETHSIFSKASSMKSSNGKSQVFISRGILFPGDSGAHEERIWMSDRRLAQISVLLAGHHGSKTATSKGLLTKLKNLKLVIASAREKKFGHPNTATRKRIAQQRIPLLSTNDWGTISIAIPIAIRRSNLIPLTRDSKELRSAMPIRRLALESQTSEAQKPASQSRVRVDDKTLVIR